MSYTRLAPRGLFAALLLLGPLCGCGGSGSSTPVNTGPVTSAPRTFNNLQFTLTADKSMYKVGESINFTVNIQNVGTQPVQELVGNPFTIITVTQGTQAVWHTPSPISNGGQGVPSYTLQPGDNQTFKTTWPQTALSSGKQVTAGQYTASAQINDFAQALPLSNSIQITIIP